MSLPRYPEYEDSGEQWLGDIPSHWGTISLKRLASLKSGDAITAEQIETEGEFPVYGGNGLRGFADSFTHEGHYALIGRQGALCGNINYASGKFWASEHAVVVAPIKPVSTIWLGELLRTMNLNQYSVSAAQPGLSVEIISNLRVPFPSLAEQSAIATFLDRETAKIDALIAEQEKLLTLLAEKREATISHAVTKGLNPDVPMKDSGVEWLGEVPAHWLLGQLKNFVLQRPGAIKTGPFGSHLTSAEMQEGIVKVYNQLSVIDNNFVDGENYISEEKFAQLSSFQTFPGDVLVTTRGTIGRAAILPLNAGRGILHPCLLRVQVDELKLLSEFLVALVQDSHLMKTHRCFSVPR